MRRMSLDDYKKEVGIHNTGKARSVRKNDSASEVRQRAMETLRNIQDLGFPLLFKGDVKLTISVFGRSAADADNLLKGIMDALQGVCYENDRQVREASIRIRSS